MRDELYLLNKLASKNQQIEEYFLYTTEYQNDFLKHYDFFYTDSLNNTQFIQASICFKSRTDPFNQILNKYEQL